MFTGIVSGLGEIQAISALGDGLAVTVSIKDIGTQLNPGDSIALNGVCTTALDIQQDQFTVQLLDETLKKTTFGDAKAGHLLNWELSVTPQTRMGGHFVYGHVDEMGEIVSLVTDGPWAVLTIAFSPKNRKYLVPKGSITVHGISLTLVEITETTFSCHLIPHTLTATNLHRLKAGNRVNLEYDIIGKYLYNFQALSTP